MKTTIAQLVASFKVELASHLSAFHKAETGLEAYVRRSFDAFWNGPAAETQTKQDAIIFKRAMMQAANEAGYDGSWVGKMLIGYDGIGHLFRERAVRSNKGEKAGANARTKDVVKPLSDSQMVFEVNVIRATAKKLKLDSVVIEALVLAIMHANDELAKPASHKMGPKGKLIAA